MGFLIPLKITKGKDGKDEVKKEEKTVVYYGDSSWLEEETNEKIMSGLGQQRYWSRFAGVAAAMVTGLATVHVPFINHRLNLYMRLGAGVGMGIAGLFITDQILGARNTVKFFNLIKDNDMIPCWTSKDRVMQKDRVFFNLDDDKGFYPSILYDGMSEKQLNNIMPDLIFGNKDKSKFQFANYKNLINNQDYNKTEDLMYHLTMEHPTFPMINKEQH